ncbi:hypothetical protein SAMN06273570_3551 [Candidatus Pantoea floridensis]|uniref:Uncharacterized protein n=1 Tax=Candidatus Pantoea floridensis TaxID=1938870 RepID=A0A286BY88_9GAMM|nr:hypothetical protein BX596_0998 [Enterobacteriaceae bacterium JKS000233]SOD39111.1 hypothetical protein SAMN06273570_3551 [Pantoea floridensis]
MRTLRKPGDIHVGSPFMVTDSRLTDEHYAIYGKRHDGAAGALTLATLEK